MAAPGTPEWEMENEKFMEGAQLWSNVTARMPRDFKEALTLILDAKGVTVEKLAESLCVDRRTVFRWMLERNVTLRQVTAICVALDLPGNVGLQLAATSQARCRSTRDRGMYEMMISYAQSLSLSRCNTMLKEGGMEPLTIDGA